MTIADNNPLAQSIQKLDEHVAHAASLVSRLQPPRRARYRTAGVPSMIKLQRVNSRPQVELAMRAMAIIAGNPTREQWRAHLIDVCNLELEDMVNDEITVMEGSDSILAEYWGSGVTGGDLFSYIDDTTIEIDLDGEAALGWFADRDRSFSGTKDGHRWKATVRKHKRRRQVLTLILDVEPD